MDKGGGVGHGVVDCEYQEEFVRNARGLSLFTCAWLPNEKQQIKGLVFLCHGYAVECSMTMRGTGVRLARAGYAVYGMDYEGHGKSDGLQGYIPNFDAVVHDCNAFFTAVVSSYSDSGRRELPRFLLGDSMGGTVALLLHRARPFYWNGAVLVAPMCKLADKLKPHPVVVGVLKAMTSIVPTWRMVPTSDVIDIAYKSKKKRAEIRRNPYCYKGKPRLKTALELLRVSSHLENNLLRQALLDSSMRIGETDQSLSCSCGAVSLPFLILHGGDDKLTDPWVSDLLYRSAVSKDKTLKIYPGMWHNLTYGETRDNIRTVFKDIISWLDCRSGSSISAVDRPSKLRIIRSRNGRIGEGQTR